MACATSYYKLPQRFSATVALMDTPPMPRELQFSQVFNFRDVGGYQGLDGRPVRWRRLFRSDSLSGLTEADRDQFHSLGIRTVVDLRRPSELAIQGRIPDWEGFTYRHMPPPHRKWTLTPYQEGADVAQYLADRYLDLIEEGASGLAATIGVIAEEEAAPVVVHCVAGKDRTGVVCALTLSLLGVPDEDIATDYARSTANNRRYVEWAQRNGQPDLVFAPWWNSPAPAMLQFLTELRKRYGSAEQYLRQAGLGSAEIDALRHHLLSD